MVEASCHTLTGANGYMKSLIIGITGCLAPGSEFLLVVEHVEQGSRLDRDLM